MVKDVEHFFMCLLAIRTSFENCSNYEMFVFLYGQGI
jgi:hypothetical protein